MQSEPLKNHEKQKQNPKPPKALIPASENSLGLRELLMEKRENEWERSKSSSLFWPTVDTDESVIKRGWGGSSSHLCQGLGVSALSYESQIKPPATLGKASLPDLPKPTLSPKAPSVPLASTGTPYSTSSRSLSFSQAKSCLIPGYGKNCLSGCVSSAHVIFCLLCLTL